MIPPCDTPRHLHIDQPVAQAVANRHLADHPQHGRAAHGRRDADLAQGPLQPFHVQILIEEAAAREVENLVDAIRELIAAILHVHACLGLRKVAAVDVCDTAHEENSIMKDPLQTRHRPVRS